MAKKKKTLATQAAETNEFLNSSIQNHQRRLTESIRSLEADIINRVKRFKTTDDGMLEGANVNLKLAQSLHSRLETIFDEEYGRTARRLVKGYKAADDFVLDQLEAYDEVARYSGLDKESLKALKENTWNQFNQFGLQAQDRLVDAMYKGILGRGPWQDLVNEISAALSGAIDKRGNSMSNYAQLYAQDAISTYHTQVMLEKNRQAGLTHFLYYGNIMDTTRDFCRTRVGNVYTEEEINRWNDQKWSGKSGPPMTNRGGYRCRHSWVPVKEDWLDEKKQLLKDDVQREVDEAAGKEPKKPKVKVKKPEVAKKPPAAAVSAPPPKAPAPPKPVKKDVSKDGMPLPTKADETIRDGKEWSARTQSWIESQPEYAEWKKRVDAAKKKAKQEWIENGKEGTWEWYYDDFGLKTMPMPKRFNYFNHHDYKNNVGGNIKDVYVDVHRASEIRQSLGYKQAAKLKKTEIIDPTDPSIRIIYQGEPKIFPDRIISRSGQNMLRLVDDEADDIPTIYRKGNDYFVTYGDYSMSSAHMTGRKVQVEIMDVDEVNALRERQYLENHGKKVVTSSKDAKAALKEWRGTGEPWDTDFMSKYIDGEEAYQWNDALRTGQIGGYADDMKTMDGFLDMMPKTNATTYRGLALEGEELDDFLKKTVEGDIFVEPGYMSTTFSKSKAQDFGSDVILEVEGKSGSYISAMSYDEEHRRENEVLFPRGSKFMVKSVKQNKKGNWIVKLVDLAK